MEQALKKLLLTGGIGEQLLDSETTQLLNEVKLLRKKDIQAKEVLQSITKEEIQLNKDVFHMQEMLSLLQELKDNYQKDVEMELRVEKDMTSQAQGHLRHQFEDAQVFGQFQNNIEHLQNQILLREREISELEKTTTVDGHLLQELLDHLSRSEEDNLLLLRYTAADASEMKKLSIALEKVSEEVIKAECYYRECQGEANACKTVRAHLVSSFLKEAQRRDELLLFWEVTLNELKEKNTKETAIVEDLFLIKSKISSWRQSRNQEDNLLHQIHASFRETEILLSESDKESQMLSQKLASVLDASYEMRGQISELETCRLKLQSEISHLNDQIKTTKETYQEKKSFLQRFEAKCAKLEDDLQLETELLLSSEQSLRALETIRKENERQNHLLERQIEVIKNLKQRHLQEIFDLEEKIKTEKGLCGAFAATKIRIKKDTKKIKAQTAKSEEVIYNQELEIEEMKSKIHQLTHDDNNNPLNEDLKRCVSIIREKLFETNQSVLLLQRTVPLLQSKLLRSQKEVERKEREIAEIEEKVSLLIMDCNTVEREKVTLVKRREEMEVDTSLDELYLQNRIQKLRETEDEVAKTRRDRTEMEALMKEEKDSIRGEISATKTQNRDLEGRQAGISKQLHYIKTNIEQLKEKFNRIRKAINAPEEEDEISPIHVMVEIAKERDGLQEAGDLLDVEVRKAEVEVESLQKILALLSLENDQFRSTLHHLAYHSEEDAEKADLEEKLNSLEENINIWKHLFEDESKTILNDRESLRETELQLHALEDLLREKNMLVRVIEREVANQKIKMQHVNLACNSLKIKMADKKMKLADIQLRINQERLRMVTTLIGDEISTKPDIAEACIVYCQQENVPPPNISKLTRRSDYGSRSSLGSQHSYRRSETGKSRSPSARSDGRMLNRRYSSMVSLNSEDSGSSSVVSGIDQDSRSHSPSSVDHRGNYPKVAAAARWVGAPSEGKDTDASKSASAKSRKRTPKTSATTTQTQERKLQLVVPEFPKNKEQKATLKGNKILRRPSFRS